MDCSTLPWIRTTLPSYFPGSDNRFLIDVVLLLHDMNASTTLTVPSACASLRIRKCSPDRVMTCSDVPERKRCAAILGPSSRPAPRPPHPCAEQADRGGHAPGR